MLQIVLINYGFKPTNAFCSSHNFCYQCLVWKARPKVDTFSSNVLSVHDSARKQCVYLVSYCLYGDYSPCFAAQHRFVSTFRSLQILGRIFFSLISYQSCILIKWRKAGSHLEYIRVLICYQYLYPSLVTSISILPQPLSSEC